MVWLYLTIAPTVPVLALLLLRSVWWTFALYHGGVCLLLPLLHSVLVRRIGLRAHLREPGSCR